MFLNILLVKELIPTFRYFSSTNLIFFYENKLKFQTNFPAFHWSPTAKFRYKSILLEQIQKVNFVIFNSVFYLEFIEYFTNLDLTTYLATRFQNLFVSFWNSVNGLLRF